MGTVPSDDEESQMRKALGLLGEPTRHRTESDRSEPPHRIAERFGAGGGLHRRRFVQDGDVPVTVLRRDTGHRETGHRETGHEALAPRPASPPTSSRLQRVEATLSAEIAAKERAERLLHEAHAVVRDLQTKIGHAELARTEAVETLRLERETSAQLRRDSAACQERLAEADQRARSAEDALATTRAKLAALEEQVQAEARHRKAERAPRAAETVWPATETVEPIAADEEALAQPWSPPVRRLSDTASISPAIRRRRAAEPTVAEQEPVKWWLTSKPAAKRR